MARPRTRPQKPPPPKAADLLHKPVSFKAANAHGRGIVTAIDKGATGEWVIVTKADGSTVKIRPSQCTPE
ncbi:hypothetical protein [Chitinimonas lacunae]|uniref:Uncharacterized protein n=1 Tax=Chitinimonas lacunae TaxID=1963018 RepID=A0ABV8MMB8_9NEIS